MYPEFVVIYVMLVIVMAMLGTVLYFLFKMVKNGTTSNNSTHMTAPQSDDQYYGQQYQVQYQQQYQQAGSVVFCQQCATQFDSTQAYCPNCGARR